MDCSGAAGNARHASAMAMPVHWFGFALSVKIMPEVQLAGQIRMGDVDPGIQNSDGGAGVTGQSVPIVHVPHQRPGPGLGHRGVHHECNGGIDFNQA